MSPKKAQRDEAIGDVIREARLAKGLSQGDLATLLGYGTSQFISDWERGAAAIPMRRLTEIARHLDINRDKLFDLLVEFSLDRLSDELHQEYRAIKRPKGR